MYSLQIEPSVVLFLLIRLPYCLPLFLLLSLSLLPPSLSVLPPSLSLLIPSLSLLPHSLPLLPPSFPLSPSSLPISPSSFPLSPSSLTHFPSSLPPSLFLSPFPTSLSLLPPYLSHCPILEYVHTLCIADDLGFCWPLRASLLSFTQRANLLPPLCTIRSLSRRT